jgi:uncharacterized protein YqgC (DUF456 family)
MTMQTENKQSQKLIAMTTEPVEKLIVKLAVPTMVSMMITSIYNMADTFFVGQISAGGAEATSATAAVGVAFPLMAIIQAFGFMFGHGSGNFISRALGSQKTDEAERMAATGFFLALLAGTLLYDFGRVVHTQYLACSEQGRRVDALSLLLAELIEDRYAQRAYFSLGISTEQQGQVLNDGLVTQKERFGARGVVHDFYAWDLR